MKLHPLSFVIITLSSPILLSGCFSSVEQTVDRTDELSTDGQSISPVSSPSVVEYRDLAEQEAFHQHTLQRTKEAKQKREQGNKMISRSYQMVAPAMKPSSAAMLSVMPSNGSQQMLSTLPHPAREVLHFDAIHSEEQGIEGEKYQALEVNPIKRVIEQPVSTFSIDVDTGSYSNVRRILNQGVLPPKNAVRVEEMINYFTYEYPQPASTDMPFSINTELAQAPWSEDHVLLKIGLKGYEPAKSERPHANLVFLLDVSGSMSAPNKLPLLKKSLLMLSRQLTSEDKVSIVVYAGASGVVLEPTEGNNVAKIEQVLDTLQAGGSTNGQSGIQLAYSLAEQNLVKEGINRVILATDGDFNVGVSDTETLKALISEKRKKGIALTTLGFGRGNYNDHLMEQLADVGNGNYAYIDTLHEARKVLVEELSSTLMTIAKDVKIQLEFNPQWVAEYRLLGYENRMLAREDFNNDQVDAGEIGAGHSVTALYELALVTSEGKRIDPLRYQSQRPQVTSDTNELAFLKLRYKKPNESKSRLIQQGIELSKKLNAFEQASEDFRFSAVVAGFGQKLKGGKYVGNFEYSKLIGHALGAKGSDPFGYRNEMVQLMRLAESLDQTQSN